MSESEDKLNLPLYGNLPKEQQLASYTLDETSQWSMIWPLVVAEAWTNEDFKQQLLENPRRAVMMLFGFEFPENLDLIVKDARMVEGAGWTPNRNARYGYEWLLPASQVVLWLPPRPEEGQREVALASYILSGQIYPFTCCT